VLVGLVVALGAVTWDLSYVLGQPVEHYQDEHAAVVAHNTIATVVVIVGVVLAAIGARMLLLGKPAKSEAYLLFAASTLMLADGVLHFFVVSEHLAIRPFAVFFAAAASIQLGLGFGLLMPQFRLLSRPALYYVSILTTIGLIILFFVSRTTTMPFAPRPDDYDTVGILSKVLEIGTLGALGGLVYRWRASAGATVPAAPGP
jgi:4-amino-4-deoxy-L-arabinose transferase-like glycosyltransferase